MLFTVTKVWTVWIHYYKFNINSACFVTFNGLIDPTADFSKE